MKILQEVQKNFAILGICRNQSRINGKSLRTCLIYGLGILSSTKFLIYEANNFQEYTDNLYITTALAVGLFCILNMFLKMIDLFALADNVEEAFVQKSKDPTSRAIYENTNQFVETLSRIGFFVVAIVTPLCIVIPKPVACYYMYFATGMDNEVFELPLFYWFPFDWKNPFGYSVAVFFECITVACHFTFLACAATFGGGKFFFALSFTKDVENDLKTINENAKNSQNNALNENRLKILKQISEFVEFHSTIKRYIDDFLDIYQPIFLVIYVWSLVTICGVMLLVQIEIQGNGSLALILATMFYGFYAFGIVLMICELGQRLTDAFEGLEYVINEFEWNSFSLEVQKMLPIMLMGAQRPVELRCFGTTSGLRDTFKIVVNSAFSYFTVIRQFLK